jgi:hypothetical protein
LGDQMVSRRFCRCDGATTVRAQDRVGAHAIRGGQSPNHGAGGSGVSLDAGETGSAAGGIWFLAPRTFLTKPQKEK